MASPRRSKSAAKQAPKAAAKPKQSKPSEKAATPSRRSGAQATAEAKRPATQSSPPRAAKGPDPSRCRRKADLLNQLRDPDTSPERGSEVRSELVKLADVPALNPRELARLG